MEKAVEDLWEGLQPRRLLEAVDGVALHDYAYKCTAYYAGLMRERTVSDPVGAQVLPDPREAADSGQEDPLGEERYSPVAGLVHVYPDRVLLMPTDMCFVNCRHCNRRWRRQPAGGAEVSARLPGWIEYLRAHDEVEEVLVTGGDPLTLPDGELQALLGAVRADTDVGVIRLGTRAPVVQPGRVTDSLVSMLRGHHPIYLHTQFNSPAECTPQAGVALDRLADAGVNLGNQTVLLAGVNDGVDELVALCRWLVRHRCRPYYLFYPEAIRGTAHFRVDIRSALALGEELRRRLSGIALPSLVVDTPDGAGKVPLTADRVVERDGRTFIRDLRERLVCL